MEKKLPMVEIKADQCKGCLLCVEACPRKILTVSTSFNVLGYQYAEQIKQGCTGCETCYYACPEPGAITVVKEKKRANV